MKLPFYLCQELISIQPRVSAIQQQINAKSVISGPSDQELQILEDYKVRVENILLETDVKEPSKHSPFIPLRLRLGDPIGISLRHSVLNVMKKEKMMIIGLLTSIATSLAHGPSAGRAEDWERYAKMGLQLDPRSPEFLARTGSRNSLL